MNVSPLSKMVAFLFLFMPRNPPFRSVFPPLPPPCRTSLVLPCIKKKKNCHNIKTDAGKPRSVIWCWTTLPLAEPRRHPTPAPETESPSEALEEPGGPKEQRRSGSPQDSGAMEVSEF